MSKKKRKGKNQPDTSTNEVDHELIRLTNDAAQIVWAALEKHHEDGGDEDEDEDS